MSFTFKRLGIPDIILVESKSFKDDRGFFLETFKESQFLSMGIDAKFVQDNLSYSIRGVLRGLHYQKLPKSQKKLVTVIKGKIFDVVVDIRKNSPTYGKWVGEIISDNEHKSLYIPDGFAHGFCVLSDEALVSYKVSNEYSSEHEQGIIWNDPEINISWPIAHPILSAKDNELKLLKNTNTNFIY
mgnify:CR=1 FL=1